MKPPDFKTGTAWDTPTERWVDVIKYNFKATKHAPGITYQVIHKPSQWCIGRLP